MSESVKPVYREGNSVGKILEENQAAQAQAAVVITPTSETAVSPEGKLENSNTTPQGETITTPTIVEPDSSNVTLQDFNFSEEPQSSQNGNGKTEETTSDWRELIKKVDPKELYKEIGINEFSLELNDYIKNGGDPADYLAAKSIDYNKVSDEDLIKDDLKKQYPHFSSTDINRLYNRKYGTNEAMSEEEMEDKRLELKADAHTRRQQKISEQQKFKIPSPIQNENTIQKDFEQEMQRISAEEKQRMDATIKWYSDHDATKNLIQSKRVTVSLGDMGSFNFNVDKPENLMKPILNSEVWQRVTSMNPGEPDVNKLIPDVNKIQRLALMSMNPNYEIDLVNYGKSLKLKELQAEGQNIKIPAKNIPGETKPAEKELWKRAKTSTVGG